MVVASVAQPVHGVLHGLLQRIVYTFPPQMYEGLDGYGCPSTRVH